MVSGFGLGEGIKQLFRDLIRFDRPDTYALPRDSQRGNLTQPRVAERRGQCTSGNLEHPSQPWWYSRVWSLIHCPFTAVRSS